MTDLTANEKTWYIAHNNSDIYHIGVVDVGQQFTTGQPECELFDNEDDWKVRCEMLGLTTDRLEMEEA